MDILDDVLDTLALKGALYFRTDFSPPWGVTVPEHPGAARFHLVVRGHCRVELATGAVAELAPGDLVLVPRGRSHVLAHAAGQPAPPLETLMAESGYDGRGVFVVGRGDAAARTRMICGHFAFRPGADHPLLRALPDHLVVTAATRRRHPWLDETLTLLTRRVFADPDRSAAAVTRLSEVLFIDLLRAAVDLAPRLSALLQGFRDPPIARALALIHARPGESWTVEGLAAAVGLSRSRFAERFRALIGVGPMAYLAEWRLQRAAELLDDPGASIQQIAFDTGYRSPAAFTRAFAGKFGTPPARFRRSAA
ncbi:MAG: AraC family transcriptional regulator [Azospirillaceae bacterium]